VSSVAALPLASGAQPQPFVYSGQDLGRTGQHEHARKLSAAVQDRRVNGSAWFRQLVFAGLPMRSSSETPPR